MSSETIKPTPNINNNNKHFQNFVAQMGFTNKMYPCADKKKKKKDEHFSTTDQKY